MRILIKLILFSVAYGSILCAIQIGIREIFG